MELAIYKFDHDNRLDDLTTIEIGGEIWFVATDVCGLLDIKNVSDAVMGLEEDEKMVSVIPRVSKNVKVVFPQVSASGPCGSCPPQGRNPQSRKGRPRGNGR